MTYFVTGSLPRSARTFCSKRKSATIATSQPGVIPLMLDLRRHVQRVGHHRLGSQAAGWPGRRSRSAAGWGAAPPPSSPGSTPSSDQRGREAIDVILQLAVADLAVQKDDRDGIGMLPHRLLESNR